MSDSDGWNKIPMFLVQMNKELCLPILYQTLTEERGRLANLSGSDGWNNNLIKLCSQYKLIKGNALYICTEIRVNIENLPRLGKKCH